MTLEQILKALRTAGTSVTITHYVKPTCFASTLDEHGDTDEELFDTMQEMKDWLEEKIPT